MLLGAYKWSDELLRIYDPKGVNPVILNTHHTNRGLIIGFNTSYNLYGDSLREPRLKLGYTREFLKQSVNRYRIGIGYVTDFFGKKITPEKRYEGLDWMEFSIELELVRWADGRRDWFILIGGQLENVNLW